MFNNFFSENRAFYEIMWKNIVQPDRPQMTIWRMRIACWIQTRTQNQWRTEWGVNPPPRNSEGPPESFQTQPDCENC